MRSSRQTGAYAPEIEKYVAYRRKLAEAIVALKAFQKKQ